VPPVQGCVCQRASRALGGTRADGADPPTTVTVSPTVPLTLALRRDVAAKVATTGDASAVEKQTCAIGSEDT